MSVDFIDNNDSRCPVEALGEVMILCVSYQEVCKPLYDGLRALTEGIQRHGSVNRFELRKEAVCILAYTKKLQREVLSDI